MRLVKRLVKRRGHHLGQAPRSQAVRLVKRLLKRRCHHLGQAPRSQVVRLVKRLVKTSKETSKEVVPSSGPGS